jgi:hypothetical protein
MYEGPPGKGFGSYEQSREEADAKAEEQKQKRLATWDVWDAGDDDYIIPPRSWLLGNIFCRKFLSSLGRVDGIPAMHF